MEGGRGRERREREMEEKERESVGKVKEGGERGRERDSAVFLTTHPVNKP